MGRRPLHSDPQFQDWLVEIRRISHHTATRYVNIIGEALKQGCNLQDPLTLDTYYATLKPSHAILFTSAVNVYGIYLAEEKGTILPERDTRARYDEQSVAPHDWQMSGFLWLLLRLYPDFSQAQLAALDRRQHLSTIQWTEEAWPRLARTIFVPESDTRIEVRVDTAAPHYMVDRWVDYFRTASVRLSSPSPSARLQAQPVFGIEGASQPATVDHWKLWRALLPSHNEKAPPQGGRAFQWVVGGADAL